jgi:hypothetical protein
LEFVTAVTVLLRFSWQEKRLTLPTGFSEMCRLQRVMASASLDDFAFDGLLIARVRLVPAGLPAEFQHTSHAIRFSLLESPVPCPNSLIIVTKGGWKKSVGAESRCQQFDMQVDGFSTHIETTFGPLRMHTSANRKMHSQPVPKHSFQPFIMTAVRSPEDGDKIAIHPGR